MKKRITVIALGIVLAFALCGCSGTDNVNKESAEAEDMLNAEMPAGQDENMAESLETTPGFKELLYGNVGNLGIGTLAYTAPVKDDEDYRMYFFPSESDTSFVFPDAREGNAAIGRFKEIYYMDVIDVSEDGVGDVFVVAIYEENGEEYYDTRVYVGNENGYRLDPDLTRKLNEEYYNAEDYPVQNVFMHTDTQENFVSKADEYTAQQAEEKEPSLPDSKTAGTLETGEAWQGAYRTIICDFENYLSDPHELRWGSNGYIYLGIHDFDKDDIPELIIGDSVSVAVFTYFNGKTTKIADLYEPDYWGGINKMFYKNNMLLLVSNGSDGNGYVCFTYKDGDYIKGFYDDYNQDTGTINENQVSREDFERAFVLDELMQNSNVASSQINIDDKTVTINNDTVEIDKFDFNLIQW